MRFVTFMTEEDRQPQVGVVQADVVVPISSLGESDSSLLALIQSGPERWEHVREMVDTAGPNAAPIALSTVTLLAPIPRPLKNIMCLGWNYSAHADESARATGKEVKLPDHPVVFTKAPTSVNGPFADIVYEPQLTEQLDWEVELGVIIGRPGKAISVETALDHVFGYTVINDVSARDIQQRHRQFFLGKSLDGACPMGPLIVTADEIADPQALDLRCYVNQVLKQDGNTADQIFTVAETISILSRGMKLEAGDIIATGTPDGVGFARTPPEFLRHGDVVTCEISSIGRISNRVLAG